LHTHPPPYTPTLYTVRSPLQPSQDSETKESEEGTQKKAVTKKKYKLHKISKHVCLLTKRLQEHKYKAGELLTKIHKLLLKKKTNCHGTVKNSKSI